MNPKLNLRHIWAPTKSQGEPSQKAIMKAIMVALGNDHKKIPVNYQEKYLGDGKYSDQGETRHHAEQRELGRETETPINLKVYGWPAK